MPDVLSHSRLGRPSVVGPDGQSTLEWSYLHLFSEFLADRQPGATDRTDHVASIRQLAHLQGLTETQIPEAITLWSRHDLNAKIAADARLTESHSAVGFEFSDVQGRHREERNSN